MTAQELKTRYESGERDFKEADLRGADLHGAVNIIVFQKRGGRICYAVFHEKCLMLKMGCFWGTIQQLAKREGAQSYALQIAYLEAVEAEHYKN